MVSALLLLAIIITAIVTAVVGLGNTMVCKTLPGSKKEAKKKASYLRFIWSLLFSFASMLFEHKTPPCALETTAPLVTLGNTGSLIWVVLCRFRTQQANLNASKLSPSAGLLSLWSWKGLQLSVCPPCPVQASLGGQFHLDQSRGG